MDIPSGQLETLRSQAGDLLASCQDAPELPSLTQAFAQLAEVMARLEADAGSAAATGTDVTEIGEYALRLCENLADCARRVDGGTRREQSATLTVGTALWIAHHGGHLESLEPVVDALAQLANATRDPQHLAQLSGVIERILAAVSPVITRDPDRINPGRPWRVLLLNHGIVATRSHDPALMEAAFDRLARHLPEDAARFFAEGMQQMDALDYPEHVRQVMAKYHRRWTLDRSLH